MKTLFASLSFIAASVLALGAFKMSGKGENRPIVQSAFDGSYYIRSTPNEDYGNSGKTEVFRVTKDGDELIDEYPIYMRGELFLGWSPIVGGWAVVHLEPLRITSNNDYHKIGKVSRLAFYIKGKELKIYTQEDLTNLGLNKHTGRLSASRNFTVQGIKQIPRTNHYVFQVTKMNAERKEEILSFDITTGERYKAKADVGTARLSEAQVLKIAEPLMKKKFQESYHASKPYHAELNNGIWSVRGTLPPLKAGGTPEAKIRDIDGAVVKVFHTQ